MLGLSEDAVNNFQNVEVYDDWVIVKDLRGLFAKQVGRKRRKGSNPLLSAKTN